MEKETSVVALNKELSKQLADPSVVRALLATTFKGLDEKVMKQAALEGMIRGFKFKDFLEKNVYAIPYGTGYSLVTSIDYARKIGMRSSVVGKSAPSFTYDEKGEPESCTITVKRRVGQDIGEYTATVFFDEFTTGKNLWYNKPRVMLAKVAEMHALRMACPEELSQVYTEDEFAKDADESFDKTDITDDTVVVSTGDDSGDLVVPENESGRKIMILKELKRIMPDIDLTDTKEITRVVEDVTQLAYEPEQYANIIHILHRK